MNEGFGDSRVFAPFSYTYLWPTVVYKILFLRVRVCIARCTREGVRGRDEGPPPPSDRLEDVFEQVH